MCREIKFRGLKFNNEWLYGDLLQNHYKDCHTYWIIPDNQAIINIDAMLLDGNYEVMPETIGQLIGLKDKNNLDIYEGDIVKGGTHWDAEQEYKISVIEYQGHRYWIKDESFGWEGEGLWNWDDLTVIGNIHQHPNMLKSDKK